MKPSPYFYGEVKNGQWFFKDRKIFDEYLSRLKDGEYQLTVGRKFKRRTSGQPGEDSNWNGYYWAVVIPIVADEMGLSHQDAHREMKRMHNPQGYVIRRPDGSTVQREYGGDTHTMSDEEFKDYCRRIRMWASDPHDGLATIIPEPHESPEAVRSMIESYRDYDPK